MQSPKNMVAAALGFIGVAAVAISVLGTSAGAQEQGITEAQAWEIYHGVYAMAPGQGSNNNSRFYVVRHNRLTGETQYIGCEDRDVCTQLHVEGQGP